MGVTPGSSEPRFPDYDVMAEAPAWDAETTEVVARRLLPATGARFFTREEEPTARALLDRLLAQDDEPRVPVFEAIDQRLAQGRGDGYRYEDLPEDPETWRRSIAALDDAATCRAGKPFGDLDRDDQRDLLEEVRLCKGDWHGLAASHLFSVWLRYACSAFYSHPWAWNEIGFGGPAYPRGYKHLALDAREPWEVPERDAKDPIPWVERAEAARKRHAEGMSSSDASRQGRGDDG